MPLTRSLYSQDINLALFKAANANDIKTIKCLLKIEGVSLNILNENNKSLIATLCNPGDKILFGLSPFPEIEAWVSSGRIDLAFNSQYIDIIKWCIESAAQCNHGHGVEKKYATLVQKIISFMSVDEQVVSQCSLLLFESVTSEWTLDITIALLALPGINLQQKNPDNKDVFQVALDNKNAATVAILTEIFEATKDNSSPSAVLMSTTQNQTLQTLKAKISTCYSLAFSERLTELNESLTQVGIESLHWYEETGKYPTNFADLLFELSNKLSSMADGQYDKVAYNLKKIAADLGHVRSQNIIKAFASNHMKLLQKSIPMHEGPKEDKSIVSSHEKSPHRFFQRFKLRAKDLPNNPVLNLSK